MSTPGSRVTTGWGVEVTVPGADKTNPDSWTLLIVPERPEQPLCTSFTKAKEWLEDYERRGCGARLVELESGRGYSFRPRRYREDDLEKKTGLLPGLEPGLGDEVK